MSSGHSSVSASWLWLMLALAASMSVVMLNGHPLFYFDTGGYLQKGSRILDTLIRVLGLSVPGGGGGGGGGGAGAAPERLVDASHSPFYALFLALSARLHSLELANLANAVLILVSAVLTARVLLRFVPDPAPSAARMAGLAVLAGTAGSLPFIVAFLMPDIFTPVLLLMVALLTACVNRMHPLEILIATGLCLVAVISHLSHLAIAALLIPVALLGALLVSRRRFWLPPLLVALVLAGGLAERWLFAFSVETLSDSEVSYKPFLTAQIVASGPGLRYLETRCPDPGIATCALWKALQLSDDPYRLTATHIVFSNSARLGSFQHLSPQEQQQVVAGEKDFFFRVLAAYPVDTAMIFVRNTIKQVGSTSIHMTLPGPEVMARVSVYDGPGRTELTPGRISEEASWLARLGTLHQAIYVLSFLVLLYRLTRPMAPELRIFALALLAGLLVNALICGGVSQPAARYGARVAWLLPFLAVLMIQIPATAPARQRA